MTRIYKILIVVMLIGFTTCSKVNEAYKSKGVITGQDFRMCACCGGWIITIEGENYLFDSIPANSGFVLEKEPLPISVQLDWQLTSGGCPSNRITIQRIKKN
ncbi:MAG: hypothetical protein M0R39_02950 [Prolixibacteraceae bacterium]|nr:hypothetical protein [Prolixibacteraceae bacterium]